MIQVGDDRAREVHIVDQIELRKVVVGGDDGEQQAEDEDQVDEPVCIAAATLVPRCPGRERAHSQQEPEHVERGFQRDVCPGMKIEELFQGMV